MELRCNKRIRTNDWPDLFDITDIAKLVFAYVPKMQCTQLARKSSGKLQYNICSWMPRPDVMDLEIQIAILKTDNVLCVSFISLIFADMLKYPLPNTLAHILHHNQVSSIPLTDCFIPKINLQLIAPRWTQLQLQKNIRRWISEPKSDNECLVFMFQLLTVPLEIGDVLVHFQKERWLVLRQFVQGGVLIMDRAHDSYLAEMSPDEFHHLPKSTYDDERLKHIFLNIIQKYNWNLADMLWNDTFANVLFTHLTIHIRPINYSRQDWDGAIFRLSCDFFWSSKFEIQVSESFAYLDSALHYANSSPSSLFKTVIRFSTHRFFASLSTSNKNNVFEIACVAGCVDIMHTLWQTTQQPNELKRLLARCRFCRNREALEFAWSIVESDIRNDASQWMRIAFNDNNDILWQFLFDKGILDEILLFQTNQEKETPVNRLGRKPVALLATIWDVQGVQHADNLADIIDGAHACENLPVLRFLNDKYVRLSQSSIFKHWEWICSNECINLLQQVENIKLDTLHFPQYANASPIVRETLWTIAPLHDPVFFLQTSTVTLDCCVFLLEKHAIDARTLINVLKNSKTNVKLLDEIRAFTYGEVDE